MMRLIKVLFLLALSAGIAFGYGYFRLSAWSTMPRTMPEPQEVDFERGSTLGGLASELAGKGIVDSAVFFRLWVRFFQPFQKFQAGHYRFEGAVTPYGIARDMLMGKVYQPVVLKYTIPEGFTLKQVAERLEAKGLGTKKLILALATKKSFLKAQRISAPSLEGYIYPKTYDFVVFPTAEIALARAVEVFWQNLPPQYEQDLKGLGLTLHQAVTIASLIELEAVHDDEKPMISEVIWRRLKDRVPLAIDAAIIYGIKDYTGDIRMKDLRDASNPYNTRIHGGLPPTPIGSPSVSSLKAVLTPSQKGYYYYVLRTDGSQRHYFTKTLSEHEKYVRELVRATKKDGFQKSNPK